MLRRCVSHVTSFAQLEKLKRTATRCLTGACLGAAEAYRILRQLLGGWYTGKKVAWLAAELAFILRERSFEHLFIRAKALSFWKGKAINKPRLRSHYRA